MKAQAEVVGALAGMITGLFIIACGLSAVGIILYFLGRAFSYTMSG